MAGRRPELGLAAELDLPADHADAPGLVRSQAALQSGQGQVSIAEGTKTIDWKQNHRSYEFDFTVRRSPKVAFQASLLGERSR